MKTLYKTAFNCKHTRWHQRGTSHYSWQMRLVLTVMERLEHMILLQAPCLAGIWRFNSGEKHPVAGCSGLCAWIHWVSMRWECLLWERVEAKHTWASSIWDGLHENQGGPISNSTSKQCCMEWQWPPNKMLDCYAKIWHVILMRFFEGDGDTSQTQEWRCCEDMQLDITTGL